MTVKVTKIVTGLTFTEGPRWHDSALWFSDFYTRSVYRLDDQNCMTQVVEVPHRPSGLGWTPDNELMVVSMLSRELLKFDGEELHCIADLSALVNHQCNDMVVTSRGDAYIGNFGFDLISEKPRGTVLMHVSSAGTARVVAKDLVFPNGSAILDDGRTLVVAESFGKRLTAFDVSKDGSLSGRRVWADLGDYFPDGISLDADGGIWVATPGTYQVIRVEEGGKITHHVPLESNAYACVIGGGQSEYLYICTSDHASEADCLKNKSASICRLDLRTLV
tara:strand:+ start:145 stop:975 length:831 start_codon:yes stop_codon:yes gene_type:complete